MTVNKVPATSSSSLFFFFFFILSLITLTFSVSLSFDFPTITTEQNHNITVSGTAYISSQGIQVTQAERNAILTQIGGRAIYSEPLHLWDSVSNNLADFPTHFSFVIDSNGNKSYADGIAFFLAPVNSTFSHGYIGGGLGLWNTSANSSSSESFVAVEFDTFGSIGNIWDTIYGTHVGIDINSMYSVKSDIWSPNISGGVENDAWITYNASTTTLTVMFTNETGSEGQQEYGRINYLVDLRHHLPEYVIFGFSAATGDWFETNNVKSWKFSSTLLLEAPTPAPSPLPISQPTPSPQPNPGVAVVPAGGNQNSKEKTNKEGLVVGLSIGLSIFILLDVISLI